MHLKMLKRMLEELFKNSGLTISLLTPLKQRLQASAAVCMCRCLNTKLDKLVHNA